jgi:hypothetical protein
MTFAVPPPVTDSANVATASNSPTCNAATVTDRANVPPAGPFGLAALAQMLGPEAMDFYRRCAEFQRTPRIVTLRCRRCGEQFEIKERGHWRTKAPSVCPTCIAAKARVCARNWRKRRCVERLRAQSTRLCETCRQPIPEGRADRRHCSSACRQAAYRRGRGQ